MGISALDHVRATFFQNEHARCPVPLQWARWLVATGRRPFSHATVQQRPQGSVAIDMQGDWTQMMLLRQLVSNGCCSDTWMGSPFPNLQTSRSKKCDQIFTTTKPTELNHKSELMASADGLISSAWFSCRQSSVGQPMIVLHC